jgi:acylphosphatase
VAENVRVHIFYSGRVQGVGFRFTAIDIARSLGVVGWAKNLKDGKVEVVAEGMQDAIEKFMDGIRSSALRRFITGVDVHPEIPTGEYREFTIRY